MESFVRSTILEAPPEQVYAWHARPGAIERLTPPWEAIRVVDRSGGIDNGARTTLQVGLGPVWVDWVAEHCDHEPGRGFRDIQLKGPFPRWEHRHAFVPVEGGGTRLEDTIEYELPLGQPGHLLAAGCVHRRLDRTFAYRHRVTRRDIAMHADCRFDRPQRFLITGSTGLVGSALVSTLTTGGHEAVRLLRPGGRGSTDSDGALAWDPAAGSVDDLSGFDCVVHLAGENIAGGRWTPERKSLMRESRVSGTRTLSEAVGSCAEPPSTLICASAVGFYGDRDDQAVDESSERGSGYLPEVCLDWEDAAAAAREAGIRVIHLRIGIVLTPAGGALARMLPAFRLGLGGRLGTGRQYMSWVSLDDLLGAVLHCAARPELEGPVNATAPEPVRNDDFTRVLGRVLGRPTLLPVPAAVLEGLFGEMARELLLGGARAHPTRLQDSGFRFRDPELEGALRHMLGRLPHGDS